MIGKLYKHHKGDLYRVLHLAAHSETQEEMVVYRRVDDLINLGRIWVRPKAMFEEEVEVDGAKVLRFTPVTNEDVLTLIKKWDNEEYEEPTPLVSRVEI